MAGLTTTSVPSTTRLSSSSIIIPSNIVPSLPASIPSSIFSSSPSFLPSSIDTQPSPSSNEAQGSTTSNIVLAILFPVLILAGVGAVLTLFRKTRRNQAEMKDLRPYVYDSETDGESQRNSTSSIVRMEAGNGQPKPFDTLHPAAAAIANEIIRPPSSYRLSSTKQLLFEHSESQVATSSKSGSHVVALSDSRTEEFDGTDSEITITLGRGGGSGAVAELLPYPEGGVKEVEDDGKTIFRA
ncbi:hypothetical protein HDU97_004104 [Phlyctochytrium planicorne]|nr:hypothetical protein HDU97_004104 [Phlyctochytrium planicorne]